MRAHYPELPRPTRRGDEEAVLESIRVRGRCVEFDARGSRARAETELLGAHGEVIVRLIVDYHVIPELQFARLFESEYIGVWDPTACEAEYAAFYIEPIQGTGGYVSPPPNFF